ncbi:MAG: zinc-ribbon domain-containing protein [Verrucomicrobia bacterium]|nr:zinc-ribbon domain-containing protein [Verrucomicrobiota bacterium]
MPFECPNCGADVPAKAKACPECGSCEETGWSENAAADGLDLPNDSFNYDEYVQKEFKPNRFFFRGRRIIWCIVAVVLVLALLGFFLRF